MTFNEFIEQKIKEANDYAREITDEEQDIAREAWNAAVEEMRKTVIAAYPTETTSAGLAMMLDAELDGMHG